MPDMRLRPYRTDDATAYAPDEVEPGDIDFFAHRGAGAFARRMAVDGLVAEDDGHLAVEVAGQVVGDVGWHAVHHGPPPHGRALNVGIGLLKAHRGRGYGAEAQRLLAEYLFSSTRVERLEASTDVENVAEQRSLERAGFTREGVLRHSQWRAGAFHDNVLYSRLRGDRPGQGS